MEEIKLIVAGGRDFNDFSLVEENIHALAMGIYADKAVSIVSGMARGADVLGYQFALKHNVRVYTFPAKWDLYGKRAGFLRNEEMGRFADVLLAFWDGQSRGTKHMIEFMAKLGKDHYIIRY